MESYHRQTGKKEKNISETLFLEISFDWKY